MYFVYKITNLVNNKIYIGKSKNPAKRMSYHIWCATQESHPEYRQYLHNSIKKYGSENFRMEILEEVTDENLAFEKEKFWISNLKSYLSNIGYNETLGGEGCSGRTLTQETKDKMSEIAKESFKKGTRIPNLLGKNHTQESKNKMSKIAKEKGFGPLPGKSPNAILNEENVRNIRIEYETMTAPQLSQKYNVSIQTIKSIVQFKNWKHVK
jgi:group I intron endonuclease